MLNQTDQNTENEIKAWKEKYFRLLNEVEFKEAEWNKEQERQTKTLLRILFSFQGLDRSLDAHLLQLKNTLKKGKKNDAQGKIDEVVIAIFDFLEDLTDDKETQETVKQTDIDPFGLFLEKFNASCKAASLDNLLQRAKNIESEKQRLLLIEDCIGQLLKLVAQDNTQPADSQVTHLLTLLNSLTLPESCQGKIKQLASQLAALDNNTEITVLIKRLAVEINKAYIKLQNELNETGCYLKKLTTQLNDLALVIADMDIFNTETLENSLELNDKLESQLKLIKTSMDDSQPLDQLKLSISTTICSLQESMEQHINREKERLKQSELKNNGLKQKLNLMESETAKLRHNIEKEKIKSSRDALTGIANRMAFDERIDIEYQRWKRYGKHLTLCIFDIDKFKNINDTYGHKAGDKVLKTVAQKCKSGIRKVDFFARYGGEEFALILPETSLMEGFEIAEKLREEIMHCLFQYKDQTVPVTISCGLAEFKNDDAPDSVFVRADKALYMAKEAGRNRCMTEQLEELKLVETG